jgi:carboxyl-terminal processing protease
MDRRSRRIVIWTPVLLAIAVIAGILLGIRLQQQQQLTQHPLRNIGSNKISLILSLINGHYVDTINNAKLEEDAIPEILNNLDPHTSYIPAKDMKGVNEEMSGNFGGIGVEFTIQNDTIMVVDVISGGPSQKLGILAGDRIVTVDDTLMAGVKTTNKDVMHKLRGTKGTLVKVGIARRGFPELINFDITRGTIPLYSVDVSYMVNNNTGYVKVSRFAGKTYEEFIEAVSGLDEKGAANIIIDLRGNPGGYLLAVTKMVSEFLDKGELIVYTEGRTQPRKTFRSEKAGAFIDKKVLVLIDEFSASASEIFAGAMQDNDRGTVIGRRSFGKGLVQEQIPFQDGSALRLTVARYYTPSGRCIQKPYDNGNDEYYEDIMNRMRNGEYAEADSTQLSDSLTYYTRTGRAVYGGGGIMPDIFVPADTTGFSEYYSKIMQKGLVYRFALNFADSEREKLKKLKTSYEFEEYLMQNNTFENFVSYAEDNGVPKDSNGIKTSGKILEVQVGAYIARNIIGEEGFYPIISKIDNTMKKAIGEIK